MALLAPRANSLALRRVAIGAIGSIAELAQIIAKVVPELHAGPSLTLIDSPSRPASTPGAAEAALEGSFRAGSRIIDRTLRSIVRRIGGTNQALARLSMFPTPPPEYFLRCLADPEIKPHLCSVGREIFSDIAPRRRAPVLKRGSLFTRFMLAGFALFRAMQVERLAARESYPDVVFRLWSPLGALKPKSDRAGALAQRRTIALALAEELGLKEWRGPETIDQADAVVLVLSTALARRRGAAVLISAPGEGGFVLPLDASHLRVLGDWLDYDRADISACAPSRF